MKRAIVALALAMAGLGAVALRVVLEGRAALGEGHDWVLRGRPVEAIHAYERAARWYLPLAPHVGQAYAGLRGLANDAARAGDPALELAAWRAIRGAARATRGLWAPHQGDLADADAAIARLSARDAEAGPAGTTTSAREAWYAGRLARDPRPGPGAALLAALGIAAWLGGAIGLARRGLDDAGRLARRPALAAGAVIVLGLACWAVGLYNA